jgi:acyl carrier protein
MSEGIVDSGDIVLLGENSGIDSVGVLRLVMAVEKEFDIVIGDTDMTPDNLQTLKGLVSLIQQKLG